MLDFIGQIKIYNASIVNVNFIRLLAVIKKMEFTIEQITYELITANDVNRDGLGIELWNKDKNKLLIEIYRNDSKKKIEFYSEKLDLPFLIIQKTLEAFESKIGHQFES